MKGISLLCSPRLCLCVMPYLSQLLPQLKFNDGKDEEETSTVPRVGRVGKSSPNLCLLEPVLPPKTETRSEGSRALYSTLLYWAHNIWSPLWSFSHFPPRVMSTSQKVTQHLQQGSHYFLLKKPMLIGSWTYKKTLVWIGLRRSPKFRWQMSSFGGQQIEALTEPKKK